MIKDTGYSLDKKDIDQVIDKQDLNIQNCVNLIQLKCISGSKTTFVDDILNDIVENILCKTNIKLIRNNFYKLLICNFNGTFILKKLYKLLYDKIDNNYELINTIAQIEHRIIKSERTIYHLELFVYKIWLII
tara:strand:- start:361 stop:759 length:399 start_codon:yes stop_codon:yes gene_type:complete